jgi:Ca2+-binding RTX toxin-like protein
VLAAAGGTAQVLAEDPLLYAEPLDLEFGPDGFLYVAEEDPTLAAVLRVDTKTGQTTRFASGPLFTNPYALVIDPNGTIYVADGDGQVLRVSPSGSASVLTTIPGGPQLGGIERSPDGSRLWVTDDTDARIWEVLVKTGASRVVSDDPDLDGLYNIALEPAGTLVLGDTSDDEILRLDVATGAVTPITSASGPEGITVEPPVCGGRTATIAGTNAGEVITGSRFPDVIASLGGKDTIKGLAGNDIACGGNGKDKLVGGKGKDRLIGGKGADTLFGGKGKDKLKGGAGKDRQKQ